MTEALYTWRDIDRKLRSLKDPPWSRFETSIDTLVIECSKDHVSGSLHRLSELFGSTVKETRTIPLRSTTSNDRVIQILFEADDNRSASKISPRPLWASSESISNSTESLHFTASVCAFFSYKGGVGRTSLLSAVLGEMARRPNLPRILVIDGDFEAPGLTWMLRHSSTDKISFSDILSLIHDSEDWKSDAMPLIIEEIERCEEILETVDGPRKFWFLPTIRSPQELFMPPVTPEVLVNARNRSWIIGDLLWHLSLTLNFDAILIDLRAGVTESSSPLLLDPRIEKILVSTCNLQSVEGTLAVLRQIRERVQGGALPSIAITMIPPGRKDLTEPIRSKLIECLGNNVELSSISLYESDFAQDLLHFDSLNDFVSTRVPGTDLGKSVAPEIADKLVGSANSLISGKDFNSSDISLQNLRKTATQLEFAENNAETGLLPIEPLRSLLNTPRSRLPIAIVVGKKGSGKTFAWGQLIVAQRLSVFATLLGAQWKGEDAVAFPLLSPKNLSEELRAQVLECERVVRANREVFLSNQELGELLNSDVANNFINFWITIIAKRLGHSIDETQAPAKRIRDLSGAVSPVLLVVDGLEDAFQVSPSKGLNESQASLLRALIQDLPSLLKDEGISNIGLIVFIRQDLVSAAIRQNVGHFFSLHSETSLSWDQADALRLVVWMVKRSLNEDSDAANSEVSSWSYGKLRDELEAVWGERMGGKKEARTDEWVVASLSDFNLVLQARDIVRLIRFACDEHHGNLPISPLAIRKALQNVSTQKIEELSQEVPGLLEIFNKMKSVAPENKLSPFSPAALGLSAIDMIFLELFGLVAKGDGDTYYLPEIIRSGLGYSLANKGKAKVLSLYRDARKRRQVS